MNPFEIYQDFMAMRVHFSRWDYDYFRYNGKMKNVSVASYNARPDRAFFEIMTNKPDPHSFMLANLVENPDSSIIDIARGGRGSETYKAWLSRTDSLTYRFTEDLKKLDPDFDKNLICSIGGHPLLVRRDLGGHVMHETTAIIVELTRCGDYWRKNSSGDETMDVVARRAVKYKPFLSYDRDKYRKIILDLFRSDDV